MANAEQKQQGDGGRFVGTTWQDLLDLETVDVPEYLRIQNNPDMGDEDLSVMHGSLAYFHRGQQPVLADGFEEVFAEESSSVLALAGRLENLEGRLALAIGNEWAIRVVEEEQLGDGAAQAFAANPNRARFEEDLGAPVHDLAGALYYLMARRREMLPHERVQPHWGPQKVTKNRLRKGPKRLQELPPSLNLGRICN